MLLLSFLFLGAALAAPHRRTCTGNELLGVDGCAAAQLDAILSAHTSTEHALITNTLNTTIDAVTSDLISVFKSFANSTADVNLTEAGSLATDSWDSLESALSSEVVKSAALAQNLNMSNFARESLELKLYSLEAVVTQHTGVLMNQTASLESELDAEISLSAYSDASLEAQAQFTSRCVHGTREVLAESTVCNCLPNYSGDECDKGTAITCSAAGTEGLVTAMLAGLTALGTFVIEGDCAGHLLVLPVVLHEINSVTINSTEVQNLDNFAHVLRVTSFTIVQGPQLMDVSGVSNLEQMDEFSMQHVHAPELNMPNLKSVFGTITVANNPFLAKLHIDSTLSNPVANIVIANNSLLHHASGFTAVMRLNLLHIVGNTMLRVMDAFPNLNYVGGVYSPSGFLLEDNPRLAHGDFLAHTGPAGVSGTSFSFRGTSLSYWFINRICRQQGGSIPTWSSYHIVMDCYHGNTVTQNGAGHIWSCTCDPGYLYQDCATRDANVTYHFELLSTDVAQIFYDEMVGVRHVKGLWLNRMNPYDPRVIDVLENLETVQRLKFHGLLLSYQQEYLPEDYALMPVLKNATMFDIETGHAFTNPLLSAHFPALRNIHSLGGSRDAMKSFYFDPPIYFRNVTLYQSNTNFQYGRPLDFQSSFGHLTELDYLHLEMTNFMYDFSCFANVKKIEHDLFISEMFSTPFFDGFWSLTWIGGDVQIFNNSMMADPVNAIPNGGTISWFLPERMSPCMTPDWDTCSY